MFALNPDAIRSAETDARIAAVRAEIANADARLAELLAERVRLQHGATGETMVMNGAATAPLDCPAVVPGDTVVYVAAETLSAVVTSFDASALTADLEVVTWACPISVFGAPYDPRGTTPGSWHVGDRAVLANEFADQVERYPDAEHVFDGFDDAAPSSAAAITIAVSCPGELRIEGVAGDVRIAFAPQE